MPAEELETTVRRFKKAVIERALGGELTHHLGYPAGAAKPDTTTNPRNGTSEKAVRTDDGPLTIDVPRDRESSFEPRGIGKHERGFTGFDDKIIALYATEVSADFISTVTDAVTAEIAAWQARPFCCVTVWHLGTRSSRSRWPPRCARSIPRRPRMPR